MATTTTMPIPTNATRPTTFQPHAHEDTPDWRGNRRALMLQAPNSEAAIIAQLVASWDENEALRAELDLVRQQLSAAHQAPAPPRGAAHQPAPAHPGLPGRAAGAQDRAADP